MYQDVTYRAICTSGIAVDWFVPSLLSMSICTSGIAVDWFAPSLLSMSICTSGIAVEWSVPLPPVYVYLYQWYCYGLVCTPPSCLCLLVNSQ